MKKITKKHIHSRQNKKTKHATWRLFWIRVGIFAAVVVAVATSYIFLTHHTDVLGAQIAMVSYDGTGGGGGSTSCTAKYIDHAFCCNNFGKYHRCQTYQYSNCSTKLRDLGYFSSCKPTPTPKPKPTPTPSWQQAQNCKTTSYPYQVTGPYLTGYSSTVTTQNGTIKASVCTDEIEVSHSGKKYHVVEIKSNVEFDKLAYYAQASCNGKPSPDPLSDYNSDGGIIKVGDPGPGARLALYFNNHIGPFEHTKIDSHGRAIDPEYPDERKGGVRCSTDNKNMVTVYQYSPDANWTYKMDKGSKLLGRLVFSVNFGVDRSSKTIDMYGPVITIK